MEGVKVLALGIIQRVESKILNASCNHYEKVETFTMLSSQSKQKEEDTLDSDVHEWPVVLYCTTTVVLLLLVLYTLHIYFFKNIYTCSSKQL
jgi:hypothetical protein